MDPYSVSAVSGNNKLVLCGASFVRCCRCQKNKRALRELGTVYHVPNPEECPMTSPSCPNEACIQGNNSPAKVVRHGFFRVRCGRRRRFRCRGCGRTFSARTNTPYFGLGCWWPAFERVRPYECQRHELRRDRTGRRLSLGTRPTDGWPKQQSLHNG